MLKVNRPHDFTQRRFDVPLSTRDPVPVGLAPSYRPAWAFITQRRFAKAAGSCLNAPEYFLLFGTTLLYSHYWPFRTTEVMPNFLVMAGPD